MKSLSRIALLLTVLGAACVASEGLAQGYGVDGQEGTDVTAMYQRGVDLAEGGQVSAAIEQFKRVLEVDPYWADAAYNVGKLSLDNGRVTDCALYLRRYLQLNPTANDARTVASNIRQCEAAMTYKGTVEVVSTVPQNLDVRLNGVVISNGTTDAPITLPPGTYTVTALRADYLPYEDTIRVEEGQQTEIAIVMESRPYYGDLTIEVRDEEGEVRPDVTVLLDGEEVDWTETQDEPVNLRTGRYLITVRAPGYCIWQRRVSIYRDDVTNTYVRLLPGDANLEALGAMMPGGSRSCDAIPE